MEQAKQEYIERGTNGWMSCKHKVFRAYFAVLENVTCDNDKFRPRFFDPRLKAHVSTVAVSLISTSSRGPWVTARRRFRGPCLASPVGT